MTLLRRNRTQVSETDIFLWVVFKKTVLYHKKVVFLRCEADRRLTKVMRIYIKKEIGTKAGNVIGSVCGSF